MCTSITIRTPGKVFINVPKDKNIRKKWLTLARTDPASLMTQTSSYFCEDHFEIISHIILLQIAISVAELLIKFSSGPFRLC